MTAPRPTAGPAPTPVAAADLSLSDPRIAARAEAHRGAYRRALPFPHVVLDDFLPETALAPVLDEFPPPDAAGWRRFETGAETKLGLRQWERLGPATRRLVHALHTSAACDFLETLTGIEGLVPDPHLWGGGLHQIARGGFLKVHADFNWHRRLRLHRRVNLLLYLNRDWRDEWGGHLELWDAGMRRCVRRVAPVFNRCVIFSTSSTSHHGHPDPLACPPGVTRRSLALYYYSAAPAEDAARAPHSTLFRERPGERLEPGGRTSRVRLERFAGPRAAQALLRLRDRWRRRGGAS